MNMGMSATHLALNLVMAVVGGIGGFFLGRLTANVAREANGTGSTSTGVLRVAKAKRFQKGQWIGGLVVAAVLLLLASGAITQANYDNRLQCNSGYIDQFQETLRVNANVTKRSQEGQLANIRAQRDLVRASSSGTIDQEAFNAYLSALNGYERSVVALQTERVPYPTNPKCEEQ